jgi:predicted sulfurtransferase
MARERKKRKSPSGDRDEADQKQTETVVVDQSISVAGRPLPKAPVKVNKNGTKNDDGSGGMDDIGASIVLFYQYKEPVWTETEFQRALKLFLSIGRRYFMTGRGRIAPEGVNCTLTGPSAVSVRGFCQALRDEWGVVYGNEGSGGDSSNDNNFTGDKDLFQATDFKITDGLPQSQKFKSLSIRKTDELVAYGLEGDKAPSIEKFGGEHLTAVNYHEALKDKDTVVIDVRNAYETAIGTIVPPKGGATLLDPKLRNSREWPKWLASEETQKKLNGKKILTFCTGGIRCERATALINQMAIVSKSESASDAASNHQGSDEIKPSDDGSTDNNNTEGNAANNNNNNNTKNDAETSFQPNGVYHMRGGIERYLKTYPQGGFWSGKNYLFDKRMEQLPELKNSSKVEDEVAATLNAKCCLCRKPWTTYRGQHKCGQVQCGVPVLVCDACHVSLASTSNNASSDINNSQLLRCELCREGYRAPQGNPDLVAMRKRAEKLAPSSEIASQIETAAPKSERPPLKVVSDRLFLNRLPLTTKKSDIEEWLQTEIRQLHWITDQNTGAFYGSCIVRVDVFSKVLLAIKKHARARGSGTTTTTTRVANKIDENAAGGPLREFLGAFPGTAHHDGPERKTRPSNRRRRKQHQQPKIFRVLAKPNETWPPPDHKDAEYPPLFSFHHPSESGNFGG